MGAVVTDGGGEDGTVGLTKGPLGGDGHLGGGADVHRFDPAWRFDRDGAGDQDDIMAPLLGGGGEGVTHLASGGIRDEPHRVEVFASGTGGDEDTQRNDFREGLPVDRNKAQRVIFHIGHESKNHADGFFGGWIGVLRDGMEDDVGVGHSAGADGAAGKPPFFGIDGQVSVLGEGVHVPLHDGRIPHARVHRRGEGDGTVGGHGQDGDEVVRHPGGNLADDVGRGWGDEHQIGGLGEPNVVLIVVAGASKIFW